MSVHLFLIAVQIDGILCNEETRMAIIHMAVSGGRASADKDICENKYGFVLWTDFMHCCKLRREMANWLQERLIPSMVDCSSIIRATTKDFTKLKQVDLNSHSLLSSFSAGSIV